MNRLFLLLVNTLTFFGTLGVNYLFATGAGGNATVGEISDKYPTLITPSDYAFSIWVLIYLLLFGFLGFHWVEYIKGWKNGSLYHSGPWFSSANLFNGLWIVVWTNEWLGVTAVVIFLLLFSLIQLMIRLRLEVGNAPNRVIFFVWWPICIYIGWVVLACVLNIAVLFRNNEMVLDMASPQAWAIIMMGVSVVIYLLLTFSRNMREASLVGAWGILAIAYRHWGSNEELVVAALTGSAILLITSGYHAYKNRKSLPFI